MKFRKKKSPDPVPRVGDMIATLSVTELGRIQLLLQEGGSFSALLSRRPREEISRSFRTDCLLETSVFQLVFRKLWTEEVNPYYSRRLYEFGLFTYDDEPELKGRLVIRSFFRNAGMGYSRAHRRIDCVELDGEIEYVADGK